MARINHVKAFRGQRKCQYVTDDTGWSTKRCGLPRAAHDDPEFDHGFQQRPLKCGKCGKPINIGDPYKHVSIRPHRAARGRRMVRHEGCANWKPSELTSSPHLATLYAAQEAAEEEITALDVPTSREDCEEFLDQLRGVADSFADGAMEASESYRESGQAIEDGFQHPTTQSEELMERADEIEYWADEIRSVEFEEFEEESDCEDCGLAESDDCHQDPDDEEYHDFEDGSAEQIGDWAMDQQNNLIDAVGEAPL